MNRCGAKTRDGDPCKNAPVTGRTRCRMHGGKQPLGIARPGTTHGKYSKHLPTRMLAAYEASQKDPELLGLSAEVNVTDAFLVDLHDRMTANDTDSWRLTLLQTFAAFREAQAAKDIDESRRQMNRLESLIVNGATPAQCRSEIRHWQDHRRKLVESEAKRLEKMQQMVSAEQAMLLVTALNQAVRDHVSDPAILAKIAAELGRLAPRQVA